MIYNIIYDVECSMEKVFVTDARTDGRTFFSRNPSYGAPAEPTRMSF